MPRPATGLNTVSRRLPDGSVEYRWYHRATGLLIGSSRDGWTKEAAAARAKEIAGEAPSGPPSGSFGELCMLYLASPAFTKLKPRTQEEYRSHIEIMRGMWEQVPMPGITRKVVRALHAQFEDRPWRGNAILRTLRRLLNFALHDLEMPGVLKNAAERPMLYETRPREQVWTQPQIDAFLAAAEPKMRLAFALLLYTLQRPGDVLSMARPMVLEKDGRTWIRLRQAKTDVLVDVPCHARLVEEMQAWEPEPAPMDKRRKPANASVLLVPSPRGKVWRYRNFARAWDRIRRLANWRIARAAIKQRSGLPSRQAPRARDEAKAQIRSHMLGDLQRRDLRRTGVVQLAIAGATVPQIAAISGHAIDQVQKIIETYLPRRGDVALGGMELWEAGGGRVVSLAQRKR